MYSHDQGHLARTCFLIAQVLQSRGWLTGLTGDGVNEYAYAQEGKRWYRCGLIPDVAATVIFRTGGTRYHDKMGVDGDRKVSKETMIQYRKIHVRCDVMSDFASSLIVCCFVFDLGWRLLEKLRNLLHRSPHAFNPRVEMSTRCQMEWWI